MDIKTTWHSKVYHTKKNDSMNLDEWNKLRKAILDRDKHTCYRCEVKKDLTIHHLIPRSQGGENNMNNMITLCTDCHDLVEVREITTLAGILATIETETKPVEPEKLSDEPDWHTWVYGGARNPYL